MSQQGQSVNTCINASSKSLVANHTSLQSTTLSSLVIVGVVLGCGVGTFICVLVLIIFCCCGLRHCALHVEEQYMEELPEKITSGVISPEVIMVMEESPKAIRKAESDPRYMTHPPQFHYSNSQPTVLYSPVTSHPHHHHSSHRHRHGHVSSSSNPYFETADTAVTKEPLTPPVFRGQPAPPY